MQFYTRLYKPVLDNVVLKHAMREDPLLSSEDCQDLVELFMNCLATNVISAVDGCLVFFPVALVFATGDTPLRSSTGVLHHLSASFSLCSSVRCAAVLVIASITWQRELDERHRDALVHARGQVHRLHTGTGSGLHTT